MRGDVRSGVLFLLLAPIGVYAALCVLMACRQSGLVWFPGPPPEQTPEAIGLAFEDVEIRTKDGVRLAGWLMPAPNAVGAVVIHHGNAGNVAGRLAHAAAFVERGLTVLLYDYRGYGASEGSPTEEGTYLDGEAAYDLLCARGFAPERIAIYGESLGAAVAIEIARRRPAACLVVESPFRSVPALGQEIYPFLPVKLLARIRYDNEAKVPHLALPILIVHSRADSLVPFAHGRALFEAAPEPKAFLETAGGHNDGGFLQRPAWRDAVARFVLEALPPR